MTGILAVPTFIETQFPIARLSAEAYKERKAGASQTLTGLGKWWGRKPLILVRASILGMLMPASSNPKRDREIFLKMLTMDDAGAWSAASPPPSARPHRTDVLIACRMPSGSTDCERPENVAGPLSAAWAEINAHLEHYKQSHCLNWLSNSASAPSVTRPEWGTAFVGAVPFPLKPPVSVAMRLVPTSIRWRACSLGQA